MPTRAGHFGPSACALAPSSSPGALCLRLVFFLLRNTSILTPRFDPEAQTPSARWFDKPAYRTWSIFDHRSEEVAPQEAGPAVHRPVLNIVPPTSTARPSPENAPTQGMLLSATTLPSAISNSNSPGTDADRSSKYMETLHSRIDALVAENALLANLATTQVDMPPPAYA